MKDKPKKPNVVSHEMAELEVNSWLDSKRIFDSQREGYKEQIDYMIEAIVRGNLSLDEATNVFTQKLEWPIEHDGETVEKLSYKPRINDTMLKPYMNGVKPTDVNAFQIAYLACITGRNKTIVSSMDSIDKKLASSIVVFFV